MKIKYYTMEHKGGINEALQTRKEIDFEEFKKRFKKYHYKPYCYDKRINCYRFIINNMEKHINQPTWLLLEIS